MTSPEQITDALCYHAEGPVWSPSWGGLRWVDMLAGDVLTLRADGSVDRMHVGEVAAFVRPRSGGGLGGRDRARSRARGGGGRHTDAVDRAVGRPVDPDERGRRRQPGPPLVRDHGIRPRARERDALPRGHGRRGRHCPASRDHLQRHRPLARPPVRLLQRHADRTHRRLRRGRRGADPPPAVRRPRRRPPRRAHRRQRRQRLGRPQRRRSRALLLPERARCLPRSSCPSVSSRRALSAATTVETSSSRPRGRTSTTPSPRPAPSSGRAPTCRASRCGRSGAEG